MICNDTIDTVKKIFTDYLEKRGLIERLNWMGTHPFMFGQIELNSRGRYIYQELQKDQSSGGC